MYSCYAKSTLEQHPAEHGGSTVGSTMAAPIGKIVNRTLDSTHRRQHPACSNGQQPDAAKRLIRCPRLSPKNLPAICAKRNPKDLRSASHPGRETGPAYHEDFLFRTLVFMRPQNSEVHLSPQVSSQGWTLCSPSKAALHSFLLN